MKNILVTGGAGFIGSHLSANLIKSGYKVRILDLKKPTQKLDADYIQGDVRNVETLEKAIKDVDAVYHFAASVSVVYCQEHPAESYENNLTATIKVAEAAVKEKQRSGKNVRVLFAASASAYGMNGKQGVPIDEKDISEIPLSHYGAQKLASEYALRIFHETTNLPVVAFRFFNVFGPGQDPKSPYSGVVSIFTDAIRSKSNIKIYGDGSYTRDFISVYDIAQACVNALNIPDKESNGQPINLGTGKTTTVLELANLLKDISNSSVSINFFPNRESDVPHSRAKIDRAQTILKWNPTVSLRDGLKELL